MNIGPSHVILIVCQVLPVESQTAGLAVTAASVIDWHLTSGYKYNILN